MIATVLYFTSAFFGLLAVIPMVLTGLYDPAMEYRKIKKDPLKVINELKISVLLWLIAWVICTLAWILK